MWVDANIRVLLVIALCRLAGVTAHLTMTSPCSRYNKWGENCPALPAGQDWDYNLKSPVSTAGQGDELPLYHHDDPWPTPAAKWKAGQSVTVKFGPVGGMAAHGGGHAQFSISYDGGKTSAVIYEVLQHFLFNGPSDSNTPEVTEYTFDLPKDLPGSDNAVFIFTWCNSMGNREFYGQASDVSIEGTSTSYTGKQTTIVNRSGYPTIPEFGGMDGDYTTGLEYYNNAPNITVTANGKSSTSSNSSNSANTSDATGSDINSDLPSGSASSITSNAISSIGASSASNANSISEISSSSYDPASDLSAASESAALEASLSSESLANELSASSESAALEASLSSESLESELSASLESEASELSASSESLESEASASSESLESEASASSESLESELSASSESEASELSESSESEASELSASSESAESEASASSESFASELSASSESESLANELSQASETESLANDLSESITSDSLADGLSEPTASETEANDLSESESFSESELSSESESSMFAGPVLPTYEPEMVCENTASANLADMYYNQAIYASYGYLTVTVVEYSSELDELPSDDSSSSDESSDFESSSSDFESSSSSGYPIFETSA